VPAAALPELANADQALGAAKARGRPARASRALVRGIRPSSQPTFYFKHILLPHAPWSYLPPGRSFPGGPTQRRYSWNLLHFNRWLVNQSYQRHLLQVGFTDGCSARCSTGSARPACTTARWWS
jgi:hypothetical protein